MIDTRGALRNALGRFATGVTIVTSRARDGRPVGITCNSFNSVSLDPPLILWSLAKTSNSLPAFAKSEFFAVNVLAADQLDVANRFASRSVDRFQGIDFSAGIGGVPVLSGVIAVFECEQADRRDVGDHLLFIGKILSFSALEGTPLLFHAGKFGVPQANPHVN